MPALPRPPASDYAETQALIREITTEARAANQRLDFDPEAPVEGESENADHADEDPEAAEGRGEDEDPKQDEGEGEDEDAEADEGEERPASSIDLIEVQKALKAQGGVDLVGLAKALGVELESLKLSPSQAKAIRIERRRTEKTLERATKLSTELEQRYGDQVRARKAASEGDLQPAIEFVEATFGMGWNELNKMIADLLQGKPAGDLEQKRELRELKKRETERAEQAKKDAEVKAQAEAVDGAKKWIAQQIRGDKLMDADLNAKLRAAGMPTVTDMVFEEMQVNYSRGLTDPKKALERVKVKLTQHAKALQSAGVLPKPKPKPKPSVTASPPRAAAQAGSAGNGRDMTDAELRRAVLTEAGLVRQGAR